MVVGQSPLPIKTKASVWGEAGERDNLIFIFLTFLYCFFYVCLKFSCTGILTFFLNIACLCSLHFKTRIFFGRTKFGDQFQKLHFGMISKKIAKHSLQTTGTSVSKSCLFPAFRSAAAHDLIHDHGHSAYYEKLSSIFVIMP